MNTTTQTSMKSRLMTKRLEEIFYYPEFYHPQNQFFYIPIDLLIIFYIVYLFSTEKSEFFFLPYEKNSGTSLKFCTYVRLHILTRHSDLFFLRTHDPLWILCWLRMQSHTASRHIGDYYLACILFNFINVLLTQLMESSLLLENSNCISLHNPSLPRGVRKMIGR